MQVCFQGDATLTDHSAAHNTLLHKQHLSVSKQAGCHGIPGECTATITAAKSPLMHKVILAAHQPLWRKGCSDVHGPCLAASQQCSTGDVVELDKRPQHV